MAMLYVIDRRFGDKRIQWEEANKKDVKKAEKLFKDKIKEGFLAVGYKAGEKVGELIRKFDKSFDRIVMTPPLAGG